MNGIYKNAFLGSLVADALAMPVHWYYDRDALDADYPNINAYCRPKNPHPDSILWRSSYKARNPKSDILKDQAQYWGQRGIHYHQFLQAGENTVNFKLAIELYAQVLANGNYTPALWAERYTECLLGENWHRDTYLEEYHRAFFDNFAQGRPATQCGIDDVHIGGLSQIPALLAALVAVGVTDLDEQLEAISQHNELTHKNRHVRNAAHGITRMLHAISSGTTLEEAITLHGRTWVKGPQLDTWCSFPDRTVIGRHLSSACYLPGSFTASLYLAWKYAHNFEHGVIANARCGGDNCHRGAIVGALLGASNEIDSKWIDGLKDLKTTLTLPAMGGSTSS